MAKRKVFEAVINAAQELRKLGGTQAERMARAAEQGYGIDFLHGSPTLKETDAISLAHPKRTDTGYLGNAVYGSRPEDEYIARAYAGRGGEVHRLKTRASNFKDFVYDENYRQNIGDFGQSIGVKADRNSPEWAQEFAERMQANGYEGARGLADDGTVVEYAIYDPSQVRSVNADFNPANRDSPNLLAGITGAMPYAAGTAALLSGVAPEEAEAGPLQTLGRAAPYLTSAALGGAAALQSGDAEAGAVRLLKGVDPARLIFREEMQNRLDQVRELFPAGEGYSPIVAVKTGSGLEILDGHNRAVVARERGESLPAVEIPENEYLYLKDQGFDDIEISYGALTDIGDHESASMLNQQFPGADISGRGDKVAALLMERGSATPALLGATAVGTGAGMYAASDAEAGTLDALGRAAPYLATGALGAAMMTPQDAQAEPISIMPPNYNDTMQRTQAAINKIDQFKAKRAGKRGAMDIMKLELQTLLKGANEVANDVILPALSVGAMGVLSLTDALGAMALKSPTNRAMYGVASMNSDKIWLDADRPLRAALAGAGALADVATGENLTAVGQNAQQVWNQDSLETTGNLGDQAADWIMRQGDSASPNPLQEGAAELARFGLKWIPQVASPI